MKHHYLKNKIAVALDQMNEIEAIEFVKKTKDDLGFYKIGLELFLRGGKDFVKKIEKENVRLFLDLKLHDIPTTVEKSIQSLSDLSIDFLTVHLTGGRSMLEKSLEAQKKYLPHTKILGVSYLTSLSEKELFETYQIDDLNSKESAFKNLFSLAQSCGVHGVVHSGLELEIANEYPFISVCPGIRFLEEIEKTNTQDQKRVLDPKSALSFTSSKKEVILVIGRSLTQNYLSEDYHQRIRYLKNLEME